MPFDRGRYLILFSVSSHILLLLLLSIKRSQLPPYPQTPASKWPSNVPTIAIRCVGLLSATITLILPYTSFPDDPFIQSGIRCVCFFYACKLLDLSIAQANSPPTRLQFNNGKSSSQRFAPMESQKDHLSYTYLLLTEMRYPSFDIAIKQKDRPHPGHDLLKPAWSWMPPILICTFAMLIPMPELLALMLLLVIQFSFEALHFVLHLSRNSCSQPLFYKPFAASSFASFWGTHWHAAAAPFLQNLGFRPGKRYVGKWFGVLATFNLTGIWHAWAAIPYCESQYKTLLGLKVWAIFMMWGLGILVERWIWGERQGRLVQRLLVWSLSVFAAGSCIRTFECHTTVDWLRANRCESNSFLKRGSGP